MIGLQEYIELTLRDGRKTLIRASFIARAISEPIGGQECTRLEISGCPYAVYVTESYEDIRRILVGEPVKPSW